MLLKGNVIAVAAVILCDDLNAPEKAIDIGERLLPLQVANNNHHAAALVRSKDHVYYFHAYDII